MNILLCTLGASWAVIPEILGWIAPNLLDLYAHHPPRSMLDELRERHQLQPSGKLWICTTQGEQTQKSLEQLQCWWENIGMPLPLRIWTAAARRGAGLKTERRRLGSLWGVLRRI